MNIPQESCLEEERRSDVRQKRKPDGSFALNGIDYIDVGDDRLSLTIHFLHDVPARLTAANLRIDGGRRITGISVLPFKMPERSREAKRPRTLTIRVDREGDFSPYTLRVVEADAHGRPGQTPLAGFDPFFAQAEFSFKVSCPTDLDCGQSAPCPPAVAVEPDIDYLTKDYAGFRQLMLDRLSLVTPLWQERHAADLGITLVELLAYVGDHLSYFQDAVATEAYIGTARKRVSVRRHARLVDYTLSEGCNARAWIALKASKAQTIDVTNVTFGTRSTSPNASDRIEFAVLSPKTNKIFPEHNDIKFYTWGNRECCLPRGSTSATLWFGPAPENIRAGIPLPPEKATPVPPREPAPDASQKHERDEPKHPHKGGEIAAAGPAGRRSRRERAARPDTAQKQRPQQEYGQESEPPEPDPQPIKPEQALKPGDVLIFEEMIGPRTGQAADADPRHRHVVRLTRVEFVVDPLSNAQLFEVEWDPADQLPFALCISTLGAPPLCPELTDVSVAHGNVVLVDHGIKKTGKLNVPPATGPILSCVAKGHAREVSLTVERFRPPPLAAAPITHSALFPSLKLVAARQSRLLSGLMDQVRAILPSLISKVKTTRHPLGEVDVNRLLIIFGLSALVDAGLVDPDTEEPLPLSADAQLAALCCLLSHENRTLAKKAHRVKVLTASTRAGYILSESQGREIGEMFGIEFAEGLDPENPRWLGPARDAIVQDVLLAVPAISLRANDPAAKLIVFPELCSPFPGRNQLQKVQSGVVGEVVAKINELGSSLLARVNAADLPLDGAPLTEATQLLRLDALRNFGLIDTDDDTSPPYEGRDNAPAIAQRLSSQFERVKNLKEYLDRGFLLSPDEVRDLSETFVLAFEAASRSDSEQRFSSDPPDESRDLWCPKPDLLSSQATDRDFVAEIGDDGRASLRFGDGNLGQAPEPGSLLAMTYRVGNGTIGNVPAETIIVVPPELQGAVETVRNPLPASGGVDPEPIAQAKMFAPGNFRKQKLRAITVDDYAELAGSFAGVQRAAASMIATGGLREVLVAIDALGTEQPDPALIEQIAAELERYRRIGHDVYVIAARYVALDISLEVTAQPEYLRAHVEADLLRKFSSIDNPDGTRGLLHPDNLSFGAAIELSRLVAAAQGVAGVRSVKVLRLRRLGDKPLKPGDVDPAITDGILKLGALEIPRLDNDPSFPEHGTFRLTMRGGR
jgi:hypothetical protein